MARADDPTRGAQPIAPGAQTVLLEEATILGSRARVVLGDAIQHARENLSIDGAPTVTLTVLDRDRQLIDNADFFQQQSVLTLGGRRYVLVQVDKQAGGVLALTFEQWEVYVLRQRRSYRKAYRKHIDRVTFARSLCRESKIKFFAPEHGPPPPKYQKTDDTSTGGQGGAGFQHAGLKIGSSGVGAVQRAALEAAFGEALRLMAKGYTNRHREDILTGMVMAGIQESAWNPKVQERGGSNHWGLFQQNTGAYTRPEKGDPVQAAHEFLCGSGTWNELPWRPRTDKPTGGHSFLHVMQGWSGKSGRTLGYMVELTQGAGLGGGKYDQWRVQANAIVRAYNNPDWTGTRIRTLLNDKYEFSRGEPGHPETSWDALGRLADQIGWRRFMVGDTVWFVSDEWLLASNPVTTLSEDSGVVNAITWSMDVGKARDECDVNVNDLWVYSPGVIVQVEGEGPADGKWLLAEWDRDLLAPSASLRLLKPGKTRPEPVGDQTGKGFKDTTSDTTNSDQPVVATADAKLAHALTKNARIGWANSSFKNDVYHATEIVNGQTWMDKRVLQVVQLIADRGYTIRISSAISTHPVGVNGIGPAVSNHKYGGCVDIDMVNGVAVSITNKVAHQLFTWLHTITPTPEELLSPWADDGHHGNHIHCGFKEIGKRLPYRSTTPRWIGPY